MKTRTILQLATLLLLLLGRSTEGLFFSYPKNSLAQFFNSLHRKKEVKEPQKIHHYHLHYYPVQVWANSIKAPEKQELEKLHSNHLESLGWGDHEYNYVPESHVYRSSPPRDPWSENSLTPPWSWEESGPGNPIQSVELETEVPKSGIIVQVPLHQNIIVQQPAPKEEKPEPNALAAFFRKLRRIKNSIFSDRDDGDESDRRKPEPSVDDMLNAFVVYLKPEIGRQL